jgi:ribosomal subunit interface protein
VRRRVQCTLSHQEDAMSIPTEISFHGIDQSDAVEASVQRWVGRLEHVYDRITKCGVTISQPHKHKRHGSEFNVGVVLEVPGNDIVASHMSHEDVYVAIADAFRAVRRQVSSSKDIRRGFVKTNVVGREGSVGVNVAKARMA